MAASYPTATKSFTTKVTNDVIEASHVNDLQAEVTAVENGLRTSLAHDLTPDGDATRVLGSDSDRWVHPKGTVSAPGIPFDGDDDTGVYSSGADALELTTGGTKALGIDSTQFIDSPTQPRCQVFNSVSVSIADSTTTKLTWDSESFDVGGMHSTVSNTSRLTIPTGGDGLYFVLGGVWFDSGATGVRSATILKNGLTVLNEVVITPHDVNVNVFQVAAMVVLAAGDYVELEVFQNSGGALTAGGTGSSSAARSHFFAIVKLW